MCEAVKWTFKYGNTVIEGEGVTHVDGKKMAVEVTVDKFEYSVGFDENKIAWHAVVELVEPLPDDANQPRYFLWESEGDDRAEAMENARRQLARGFKTGWQHDIRGGRRQYVESI